MSDILIDHQLENMIINVFGMHFDFIILYVSTIMEVPLLELQIGPCLKCNNDLSKSLVCLSTYSHLDWAIKIHVWAIDIHCFEVVPKYYQTMTVTLF